MIRTKLYPMLRTKLTKRRRHVEEEEERRRKRMFISVVAVLAIHAAQKVRSPSIFRKRWDSEYLVDLAIRENSFITEYRLNP